MRKYNSLPEIAEALNNDLLQINELPEVIDASGFRQGDRDMSVAIDNSNQTILMYDEEKDTFLVEPYLVYGEKIYSVELTDSNIEQIISSLKMSIKELGKSDNKLTREVRLPELKTLLNYLESIE